MPHSPIIPETPRNRPTMVFLRQRGSRNSSTGDPMLPFGSTPAAAAALAFSHESGSFSANMIGTTISDGRMPTKNSTRQPEKPPTKFCAPGGIARLTSDPMMLPRAESAWSDPSATARNWPGTLSATSVVAAPNIPPMPRPTRKR